MAKKTKQDAVPFDIINGNFDDHDGYDIEVSLQGKLQEHENSIGQKMSGIRVNGSVVQKDGNGIADINVPTVDQSLNTESTNPVQNAAVAANINALNAKAVQNMRTEPHPSDPDSLMLIIENPNGDEVASCAIPKASEGGDQTYARVTISLSSQRIKRGDSVVLTWKYNHYNGDGTPTGRQAQTITIRAVNGTTETYREELSNVDDNTQRQVVLGSDVLTAGTVGIYVTASVMLDDGTEQRAQGYKAVNVVTIDLTSSADPAGMLAVSDGYTDGQIDIPFTLTGPRGSVVTMFLDGEQFDTRTINTSSTTLGHFYIPASELVAGRHNVQMVAESDGLLSNVIWVDVLKAGGSAPYVGMKLTLSAGDIEDMPLGYDNGVEDEIPITVGQFTDLDISFGAWNPSSVTSTVVVAVDGETVQTLEVGRSIETLTQRFDEYGQHTLTLTNGTETRSVAVNVSQAIGIDEQETDDYFIKLSASGRSNSEANPADWGGITTFENVDWKTSGWVKRGGIDTLYLTNKAKAMIDFKAYELSNNYSIAQNGLTVEMEVLVSQVLERGATLVSCMEQQPNGAYLGYDITTVAAGLHLGQMQNIQTAEEDEQGNPIVIQRELGVTMDIAHDKWMKVAFVMQPNSEGRKVFLFINGVMSKGNRYDQGLNLVQDSPKGITFDSEKADVYVRSVRIYKRALNRNELLSNQIVDQPTLAEMLAMHERNSTSAEGSNLVVAPQTLITRGGGVLIIYGKDPENPNDPNKTVLDYLYRKNNKKLDAKADAVYWYSPLGRQHDFIAYNVYIRIQGTSSTKYPWKNIRIYLNKGPKTTEEPLRLFIGGSEVSSYKYPLRGSANSIAQSVLCAKTDFVDSSMTLNTGGARLFDDTMRSLNLLTPPQQYDARVRQAVDGIPCDMFAASEVNGNLQYYGQYNLNNEKSKSGEIFGMEKVKDSNGDNVVWDCPIALEALNNGSPMTLFQSAGSAGSDELEAQMMQYFDDGFEFNFPEDTFYNPSNISDPTKESEASAAQKTALKRLFGWIYDVTPADMRTNPEYGDRYGWTAVSKAKWVSSRFRNEISQYFDLNHLLTYYLIIDYLAGVDQRAKNILWRTWDGLKWYSTFYDGDTAEGIRNDAFIAYLYNVTRDTWDDERAKYAFEGHNSWLWCLVLANFEDELRQCASNLRAVMTTPSMLRMFNETIMGNWSERQYNESQQLKYVDTMDVQNYIYTMTGNREAHRTSFYTDRGQLLDARYAAGGYTDDNIGLYTVRDSSDANDIITLKSGDLYYFGWKLANGGWRYGPIEAENNEIVNIPVNGTLAVNDPIALCGASRVKELDFTGMLQGHLRGNLDLSKCVMLSKLVMNANNGANGGVTLQFGSISKIEYADFTGQTSTGTNDAHTALDMSAQGRLQTLYDGGTSHQIVTLPEGSPLSTLVLPSTITQLSLKHLPDLRRAGLTLQGTQNVTTFIFAACPNLDWQELLALCPNVQYIRVEGITGKVHYSFLQQYLGKRGIDEYGNQITFPALTGSVTLMETITDEQMAELRATFRYLDIIECQYSLYEIDDTLDSPACVRNMELGNEEGSMANDAFGDGYIASGHAVKVRNKMKPYFGHLDAQTNKWTGFRVSDSNYKKDANGDDYNYSDSLDNSNDLMMVLPHCFYKGVNDFKNQKKYIIWSALDDTPQSSASQTVKYHLDDVDTEAEMLVGSSVGVRLANITVDESNIEDEGVITSVNMDASALNVYKVNVEGMKQVRWPGIINANYGVCFTDADGVIINKWKLEVADNDFDFLQTEFDYLFLSVPQGAKEFFFTVPKTYASETRCVVIVTDSDEIEAIEPDWVEHKQCLIGVYQAWINTDSSNNVVDYRLRSLTGKTCKRGNGTSTTAAWTYDSDGNPTNAPSPLNFTMKDFQNVSRLRGEGFQLVDYEMSKFVALLFYCVHGTLDSQKVCGDGTSGLTSGYSDSIGNNSSTGSSNTNGPSNLRLSSGNKCLGLESFFGCYLEWMDNCCVNRSSYEAFYKGSMTSGGSAVNGRWSIFNPDSMDFDGNGNQIKQRFSTCPDTTNTSSSGGYIKRVRHGRFCDLVPSVIGGTSTKRYCDYYYYTTSGRVLARSVNSGYANAGVAYAYADFASSHSSTYYGSRLAFRGDIVLQEPGD